MLQGIFFWINNVYHYRMMWRILKFSGLLLWLCSCSSIQVPPQFTYQEIETDNFVIATWQKITNPQAVYKVYIEGDGNSFDMDGQPTTDPTPRGTLVRQLAFGDNAPNVIYLARPCQFIMKGICSERHWSTARFAPEIITAEYEVLKQIAGKSPLILVGFSGGAQIAGLITVSKPDLNVLKVITIAGNLDHLAWTQHHNLPSLSESMNLEQYRTEFLKINQMHYVGTDDDIVPSYLIKDFVGNDELITVVKGAEHNSGWDIIFEKIWAE